MNLLLYCKVVLTYCLAYRKRIKYDLESTPATKLADLINGGNKGLDILLLGDSVTERISNKDQDKRPLFSMIKDGIGTKASFYHISHSAYVLDIFYLYITLLQLLSIKPETIVIPLNLRSFSPQWDYNPMFQNSSHCEMLLERIKLLDADFDGDVCKKRSIREYINSAVVYKGSRFNRMHDFLEIIASKPTTETTIAERKKNIFTFHYMNQIAGDHSRVNQLINIVKLCKNNDIKLVAYFTPINYKAAEKYIGEVFVANMKANINTICNQALPNTKDSSLVKIYDFSTLLSSEYFFNPEETTEHLADSGRIILSQHLLNLLLADH